MNKHLHYIVFNEHSDSAQEPVVAQDVPASKRLVVALAGVSLACLCVMGGIVWLMPTPAHAQVVAYRLAPSSQQPTILQTANGVPQVNIQTPSAAGVSRNLYSQFDVNNQGLILNNSRTNVQTQLGGWVQGNPWLVTGSAKVILNEVYSSNPSILNGYIEVAGQRAEVVIANPAGIRVSGGGFLNASKATLTTGTPILNNGSLDGYRVQGGSVTVQGDGLDLTRTDYAAIIARSAQINAGIWANDIKVITGNNDVDASTLGAGLTPKVTPQTSSGNAPAYALDVSKLGGMYAGKIMLIGTEAGVGVRNAGTIGANSGDLVLQNNGWLTNTGKLYANNTLSLSADNIDNAVTGEILAATHQIKATHTLTNRGLIDGADTQIDADTLINIGTGRIYGDHLSIAAATLTNDTETVNGVTTAATLAARDRLDLGISGTLTNREHALIHSGTDMAIAGALDANRQATGLANTVNNNSATIEAGANLQLSAINLNNTNEHFSSEIKSYGTPYTKNWSRGDVNDYFTYDTTVTQEESVVVSSDPGKIYAGAAITLRGTNLTNDKSQIIAGGLLQGDLTNLNNIEAIGEHKLYETGTVVERIHRHTGGLKPKDWYDYYTTGYNPAVVVTSVTLPVTYALQNTQPTGTGTQIAALNISSLYKTNPASNASYLVETDPRFTNNKTWLGSNYITQYLTLDPTVTQKRLGDGFYEQKLIREQVANLTGQRFLADYTSDEQEYKALMSSAITFGQAYNLRPGIALTAAQVAQLTSDIVWLVEQTITLPDGSTQKALVPQIYVKTQPGDLDGSGTLLAGKEVNLNLSGDLTNSGTIAALGSAAGRNVVSLTAKNIHNLGGQVQGDEMQLAALQDIDNEGGRISAVNKLTVTAGQDLTVQTTTQNSSNAQSSYQGVDRVAGLYVSGANGALLASAGRDLNLVAGVVSNAGSGDTTLQAGNNLNLATVKTEQNLNVIWDAQNYRSERASADVGSSVSGGGNVNLTAGQTVSATAANVQAKNALNVSAQEIQLQAGQSSQNVDEAHQHTSKGFLSSTTTTTRDTSSTTTALGSSLGGNTVNLNAQKDISLQAANVVADLDVTLTAGGNISVEAAQNSSSSSSYRSETKSGLMSGGGLSISYGTQKQSLGQQNSNTTAVASTVGSVGGNVNISAGNQYKQVGSDVLTPAGDISITAKTVDIQEAREITKQSMEQKFEQSGLTLAVTSTVLSTLQNAENQIKATEQTKDSRMQALGTASAAANVKMAADAIQAGQGDANGMVKTGAEAADGSPEIAQANAADKAGGIGVSLSYGQSSSQSKQTAQSDTAKGSIVKAGDTTTIKATGGGEASNLTVQGSDVSGKVVNLEADNQVNLVAAQNTSSQTSTNSNSSASVGVAAQLGNGGGGLGITASVSKGSGSGNGSETTYTNTHVAGTDSVSIKSGSDTTLKGATVEGKQVTATVGGNLNIESLQDTSTYAEQNKQVGASGMIGAGASGNVNYAKSSINSNYASVTEQSGIKAGDGGFTVNVQGNTDLKGGAITSTQAAIDNNKNSFQTGGTLTTSDIENKASYEAKSVSVSVAAGGSPMPGQGLSAALSGAGMGKDSGSSSSTTTAGISGIAGDTAKRTGDNAQGIAKIFDADQVRQEIQAQTKITQEFAKQASTEIASYSDQQKQTLQDQIKKASDTDKPALQKQLEDAKNEERVLNILVGAVTGLGGTAVTKESLAAAADEMRTLMVKDSSTFAGVVDSTGKKLSNVSGTSEGMNGDGVKLGGTRVDLDLLCGPGNQRCTFEKKADGSIDTSKPVTFNGNLDEFLASPDGQKMSGPTGGVQGYKGTLFGEPYKVGSWQDKLIESFAGTHDMIGGKLTGLYDSQGNIKQGMSDTERAVYNYGVTTTAILPSIPFVAAQGLPPEVWNAVSVLLKAAK